MWLPVMHSLASPRSAPLVFATSRGAAVSLAGVAAVVQGATPASLRVHGVDEGGWPVRDAIIEPHGAKSAAGPIGFTGEMGMAQKNQQFTPGTLVVAQVSTVAFPDHDNGPHAVDSFSKPARFKIDLYRRAQTPTQSSPITGSVTLGCNTPDQMRGYTRVTDTAYAAKTDHNGLITLDVATGAARLTFWHPQLRTVSDESKSAITIIGGAQRQKPKVAVR